MPDQWIECRCGEQFLFSEGEQTFYSERRMTRPKRCRNCRAALQTEHETRARRIADAGAKQTGRIERYDAAHGFGFIKPASGDNGIYFHVRSLSGSKPKQITVGTLVTFVEIESIRKPGATCAERVTVIE
jgi:cold shock CspA family protein